MVLKLCSETVESMNATCRLKRLVSLDELRRRASSKRVRRSAYRQISIPVTHPPRLSCHASIISDSHPLISPPWFVQSPAQIRTLDRSDHPGPLGRDTSSWNSNGGARKTAARSPRSRSRSGPAACRRTIPSALLQACQVRIAGPKREGPGNLGK